jgi:hypothetical protein
MQELTLHTVALLLFTYIPTGFHYISITELFIALYSFAGGQSEVAVKRAQ